MTQARKLILLDGNSLANRAFYALRLFSTSDGIYTNAVYGFLTMLFKLLEEEKPDYLAVAFDMGRETFRHAEYAAYKGTRKAAPEEFRPQLELLREVLTALNVPWFQVEKYEADDLLGTLARQAAEQGIEALVVTGDRDALQLIDDRVTVLFTKKGISDVVRYDRERLMADLGLRPEQIVDLKALVGDPSDNIPGVPGVGEKTALKLLGEYGSLDEIYAHLEEIKGALREKLAAGRESAYLSRRLATIDRNAPVTFDPEELRVREPNYAAAVPLFKRLEFKSLLPKVTPPEGAPEAAAVAEVEARSAFPVVQPVVMLTAAELVSRVAEANPAELTLVASCRVPPDNPGCPEPVRVAVGIGEAVLYAEGEAAWGVAELLESGRPIIGFDLKPLYNWAYGQGRQPAEPVFDIIVAAYLLDPGRSVYRLEDLARQHGLGELPEGETPEALATRAAAVPALRQRLTEALEREGLMHVFRDIEMPLLPILAEMEAAGVGIDPVALQEMSREVGERIEQLTAEIYALAGTVFNIGSPKQLAEVLFERLGLPASKKTKSGGYSTDAEVLEELAPQHEIVAKILDYRTLTKLKGTYLDALGTLVARDGRVHTTFTQTVTETGRLSSKDPNLQNIPIRLEEGRRIRRAFVPREGCVFLAADYSQIELRVVAHFSGDPALREAFEQDEDIHTRTAAVVWDVPMDQVTPEMRRKAKAVNFGLIYGQTDFGLARAVGMSRQEAKAFIETYFQRFAGVKAYMDQKKAEAREKGYVTTLDGRKRYLPEIHHRVFSIRQNAERMAINTPIQGTAADLMKKAMVAVHRALKASGLRARMILQVHDELLFECAEEDLEPLKELVKREMEGAMQLSVPLKVELKAGKDWYSMEKV
ncbi:MAG TPA: DNA polymerase I [Symbiobacteriaceae bacterium]